MIKLATGRALGLVLLLPVLLTACETPTSYRPEADAFAKATAEAQAYLTARKAFADQQQKALRRDSLVKAISTEPRSIRLTAECDTALNELDNASAADPKSVSVDLITACTFTHTNTEQDDIFSSVDEVTGTVAFIEAVHRYAASLVAITEAPDQAGFVKAVIDTGNAVTSAAHSFAQSEDEQKKPAPDSLAPVSALVANAAYYHIENRRADALRVAANSAHPWIVQGADVASRVLRTLNYQEAELSKQELDAALTDMSENSDYVKSADTALLALDDFRARLAADPTELLRALERAHNALLAAFNDRERNVNSAIMAAQELFQLAAAARQAVESRAKETGP